MDLVKRLWRMSPEELVQKVQLRLAMKGGGLDSLSLEDYFKFVPNALSWERHFRNYLRIEVMSQHRLTGWDPFDFEGKVFLEVGCGLAGGLAPVALFRGAKKAMLVEPLWREGAMSSEVLRNNYYRPLWEMLVMTYGEKMEFEHWLDLIEDSTEVHRGGLESAQFSKCPDLCWSLSCLEHIPDLKLSIQRLAQVCEGIDCRHIHVVDFGNHQSKVTPFKNMYEKPLSDIQVQDRHINGLRSQDVEEMIESSGWECRQVPMSRSGVDHSAIHPSWLEKYSLDTLETRTAAFFCG